MKFSPSWLNFYQQFKEDFKLWVYFLVFQQLCRAALIISLSHYLESHTSFSTIMYSMLHGARFDSLWATCWVFVILAFVSLPNTFFMLSPQGVGVQKIRRFWGGVFTVVTSFAYIASIEYFREYKDIFNQFMFGWFFDDKEAILKTIYAEHHVILYALLLVGILFLYIKYIKFFINLDRFKAVDYPKNYSLIYKILSVVGIIVFYIIAYRGSIGPRPIQQKDAGVTLDPFLNKVIISPYSSFRYAILDYQDMQSSVVGGSNLTGARVKESAKKYFNTQENHSDLSGYLEKRARGALIPKPQHIFVIVGESLDTWPMQEAYREFGLVPNLLNLANKGVYFKYFLSTASGTMPSLNTVITGIPDEGWYTNYQKTAYSSYPTSLAVQFKKLGYETNMFYGGYLSWQRLEDFAPAQGFDNVYGAVHINNWLKTTEWGVEDGELFDFILRKIQQEKRPTFNVIMTTSNHPPFNIDLDAEGFDKNKAQDLLSKYPSSDTNVRELGHIWYADKVIGKFVEDISKLTDNALFAITGDHFGRRHILTNPSFFESHSVPFIIYGNNVDNLKKRHQQLAPIAGSHPNIGATLIELVAPAGFVYYSIGDDLLGNREFNFAPGRSSIITPDFIAAAHHDRIEYFNQDGTFKISNDQLQNLKTRFLQIMEIAEYMVKQGEVLDEQADES